jgi:hypothetical protein
MLNLALRWQAILIFTQAQETSMNLSSTVNDSALPLHEVAKDPKVWNHLKQAIATSSGFDKWQRSRNGDPKSDPKDILVVQESVLDDLVRSYLRETLETLAY